MQDLPLELLNEPFCYNDNLYRPEIIVPRSKFEYTIESDSILVKIAGAVVHRFYNDNACVPTKSSSNVSILNIYDTYGLQITLSFLKHLGSIPDDNRYVQAYLDGCSCLPELKARAGLDKKFLIEALACCLVSIDKAQLVGIANPLASCSMPIEIVAMITQSLRVSKTVSKLVISHREATIPSLAHVEGWSDDPATMYFKSERCWMLGIYEGMKTLCTSTLPDGGFSIGYEMVIAFVSRSFIASQPLASYEAYYASRECNVANCMSRLVADLRSRADSMLIDELGCWTLQLLGDLRYAIQVECTTEDGLRAILHSILDSLTVKYKSL
ncbi:Hypothetical protein POVR2_LOCUS204 [uncultured virus]|nr:Hypothetical protein POVR2_LOCUS204 [uncultured virus]